MLYDLGCADVGCGGIVLTRFPLAEMVRPCCRRAVME
jgi:hypothetical protein